MLSQNRVVSHRLFKVLVYYTTLLAIYIPSRSAVVHLPNPAYSARFTVMQKSNKLDLELEIRLVRNKSKLDQRLDQSIVTK